VVRGGNRDGPMYTVHCLLIGCVHDGMLLCSCKWSPSSYVYRLIQAREGSSWGAGGLAPDGGEENEAMLKLVPGTRLVKNFVVLHRRSTIFQVEKSPFRPSPLVDEEFCGVMSSKRCLGTNKKTSFRTCFENTRQILKPINLSLSHV
jgi:hypothetical protein